MYYNLIHVGFPTIILTPSSQSVEVTLMATFTAKANGTGPFTYQWQKGNKILHKETGTTYTVNNASEEDQSHYRCRVFNVYGNSAVSDRVWLKVTSMPNTCIYILPVSTNCILICRKPTKYY